MHANRDSIVIPLTQDVKDFKSSLTSFIEENSIDVNNISEEETLLVHNWIISYINVFNDSHMNKIITEIGASNCINIYNFYYKYGVGVDIQQKLLSSDEIKFDLIETIFLIIFQKM